LLVGATVLVSVVLALAAVEIVVRARRQKVGSHAPRPQPVMHKPDPVRGWRPMAGHYELGPYVAGGETVGVTIGADGARVSGTSVLGGRPPVVLVGCSFTMGWAVADDETWAWRLQARRPDLEVVNRGVAGYGTFQSLLVLEELLRDQGQRPARVFYGFIDHSLRNVAAGVWLAMLAPTAGTVATPYCTLTANDRLERHPPQAYPSLPLHQYLASVTLLEQAWLQWRVDSRHLMALRVTELLVSEMAALCRAAGVPFSLVILTLDRRALHTYSTYAREQGIDIIDCNQRPGPGLYVPGEGHPNGVVHQRWGDCVAAALAEPSRGLVPPLLGAEMEGFEPIDPRQFPPSDGGSS
jgi:hypothetical protein